jgi:DNA-binding protein HU-beta
MHKQELIDHLVESQNLGKNEASRIFNDVFETITQTVAAGKDVTITGFGTFKASKRAARVGRNPQTGAELKIKAHTVPVFHAGKKFKDAVK